MRSSPRLPSLVLLAPPFLASALLLAGCLAQSSDELGPSAMLGDDEWSDDGPPAGEGAESEATDSTSEAVVNAPAFQLPFPCGQVWAGQTRTNHSPVNSVDFNRSDDLGDTVVAAAQGKVSRVENEGSTSYGRWVEIDHGGGFRTRYAHLSTQVVKVGQSLAQGQKLGTVGSTGGSTGPHLHYELRKDGIALRPFFNGKQALFFGTTDYTSKNSCGGGNGNDGGGDKGVTGTVDTAGPDLTVRAAPSTSSKAVGSVDDGAKVKITCQIHGSAVTGTFGKSTLWDFIGTGYIADAYVSTGSDGQVAPTCP